MKLKDLIVGDIYEIKGFDVIYCGLILKIHTVELLDVPFGITIDQDGWIPKATNTYWRYIGIERDIQLTKRDIRNNKLTQLGI